MTTKTPAQEARTQPPVDMLAYIRIAVREGIITAEKLGELSGVSGRTITRGIDGENNIAYSTVARAFQALNSWLTSQPQKAAMMDALIGLRADELYLQPEPAEREAC